MTYKEIRKDEEVRAYLKKGNENLGVLGYTDHSEVHCVLVAERAAYILKKLDYTEHDIELAKIAGMMHDIGNAINRKQHAEYGALLAGEILKKTDMSLEDRITVMSAIGHHDESAGGATDVISAALIIADKTDVRRNRVRDKEPAAFDIHDRVNYAALKSDLIIDREKNTIQIKLELDDSICSVMDYFEIFLERMLMCRRASEVLGCKFKLSANGSKLC